MNVAAPGAAEESVAAGAGGAAEESVAAVAAGRAPVLFHWGWVGAMSTRVEEVSRVTYAVVRIQQVLAQLRICNGELCPACRALGCTCDRCCGAPGDASTWDSHAMHHEWRAVDGDTLRHVFIPLRAARNPSSTFRLHQPQHTTNTKCIENNCKATTTTHSNNQSHGDA